MESQSHSLKLSGQRSLDSLSDEQQHRLGALLDEYLSAIEQRSPIDRSLLVSQNSDIADVLEAYFEKLDELQLVATGLGQSTEGAGLNTRSMEGQKLGDYRLVREIGRGGMGVVFQAVDDHLNRCVAVKLLPLGALLDGKHIERFKNEAKAAANLDHANIIPVYGIGEDSGINYYAMQFIDGPSLDRRIEEHRTQGTFPPVKNVLKQFSLVADALHSAHEHGIVHRDIKPSNLILDGCQKLWIADFGLARVQSESALTQTGEMVGTLRYMSPEQASGRNELVDHRTDVYSLGATLYELLTLQCAVPGEEGPSLLRRIESHSPTPVRRLRPECSPALQTVLQKAMAFRKEDRYRSAGEFAEDLRNLYDDRPINARAVSPLVQVTRVASRHSLGLLIACSILLVAAIGLVTHNALILRESSLREQNLENARTSVEDLARVADELAMVPGGQQLRRKVLSRTLEYYREFAKQASEDDVLRAQIAVAYSKMGAIQEDLGQPGHAIEHYQCAEAIYSRLIDLQPDSQQYVVLRSRNLNRLGLALAETGNSVKAVRALEEHVDDLRELVDQTVGRSQLALTLNNLGLVLQKANRPRAAKISFNEAIALLQEAWNTAPDNPELARGLAAAYRNVGSLVSQEQSGSAIEHLHAALELQLKLAGDESQKPRLSRDLVSTYLHLGRIYLDGGKLEQAKQNLGEAAKIAGQLVRGSPQVTKYRRDFAVVLNNLGMTEFRLKQYSRALDSLGRSEQAYRELTSVFPASHRLRESLAITLNNKGLLLEEVGSSDEAAEVFAEASAILEQSMENNPTVRNRDSLRQVYMNRSRILYAAGREDEAAEFVQKHTAMVATPLSTNAGN